MDIRQISSAYSVTPQIEVADIPAIAEAGFGTIICNRPDAEVMPPQQANAIRNAAEAAGLVFVEIPVTHQTLNMDIVAAQREALDGSDKPVLAYCASGTRSTIVWALGQANEQSADKLIETAGSAGYDLSGLRPQLNALSQT